jgi:hypothetical protein
VLRLTERQGQQVLDQLEPAGKGGQRDLTGVLKTLRDHYRRALPAAVAQRLLSGPGGAPPGPAGSAAPGAAGSPAGGAGGTAGEAAGAASDPPADAAPADDAAAAAADGAPAGAAAPAAEKLSAAVSSALSTFLTQRATAFAAAVRDPAEGITVQVTFPGVTRQGLAGDLPPGEVTVRPGWPRRG